MDESMDMPLETQAESISLDSIARENLSQAANWARLLAIMGFIGCGVILIAGIFMGLFFSFMNHIPTRYNYSGSAISAANRTGMIGVIYSIGALLFFFRCLYLFRFANKMRSGLQKRSQDEVNQSFNNLKKLFRYNGIMTLVIVSLYMVMLFAVMIAALNR